MIDGTRICTVVCSVEWISRDIGMSALEDSLVKQR